MKIDYRLVLPSLVLLCSSILLSVVLLTGCGGPSEPAAGAPDETADDVAAPVSYEPAYPAEVSDEGLSEEDVEHQRATHSHDEGDDHAHGDEDEDDHHH